MDLQVLCAGSRRWEVQLGHEQEAWGGSRRLRGLHTSAGICRVCLSQVQKDTDSSASFSSVRLQTCSSFPSALQEPEGIERNSHSFLRLRQGSWPDLKFFTKREIKLHWVNRINCFFETMPLQEIRTVPYVLGENDGPVFIAKDRKSGLTWEWPWLRGASS